jgi:cardiolipin synthase
MAEESLVPKGLRLMTWNIHLGKHYTGLMESIKTEPAFQDLDVLVLQESTETEKGSLTEDIAKGLGPDYAFRHESAQILGGQIQANAVIWNTKTLKEVKVEVLELPLITRKDALRYGKIFRRNRRLCLRLEAKYGAFTIRIYAPHFDTAGGLFGKLVHLDAIHQDNENLPEVDAVFIAGDLNTFAIRRRLNLKSFRNEAAKRGFADLSQAITTTWNSRRAYSYLPSFDQKLDWILLKSELDYTYTTQVLRIPGSDHYPLVTYIKFQKPQEISWEFYWTADSAWKAMLQDCQEAKVSIDFESYIFIDDAIGKQFVSTLIQKAERGVKVRLLVDALGSFTLSGEAIQALKDAGVQVIQYNPPTSWITRLKIFSCYNRDHRKILIVDNLIGYTGGVGINEAMSNWRDTQVRIQGPIVDSMAYAFDYLWKKCLKEEQADHLVLQNSGAFMFRVASPSSPIHPITEAYIDGINSARNLIYITTPYLFVPPKEFFQALLRAVKRGVDLQLLLPGESDHKILDLAVGYYFDRLLRAGVKIHLYENTMIHCKTAVIDDNWSTVGSMNLDMMSFYYNHEANIFSFSNRFNADLKKQFLLDLKNSKEITLADWKQRSFWRKIFEVLLRPFHMFF